MRVNKKGLSFLKEYVGVSETSTVLGDKLKIEVAKGKVTYSQRSKDATLITSVSSDTAEDFSLIVQTKMFWDFINTIGDDEELIITEKGISLGEDKNYTFESYDLDFPKIQDLIDSVESLKSDTTTLAFDFKDFDKLSRCSKYMGKNSLETVGLLKDKIVGTDKVQISYADAGVTLPSNYFLSRSAVGLILSQKSKESVRIFLSDKFYTITIDSTVCIFEWKSYSIPDLFEPNIFANFNQTDSIKLNKAELLSALTRMSFFVSNNPSNRIFLTVEKDSLLIENKDFNKSYERIPLLEGNKDLIGATVIVVNCANVIGFVNSFSEDEILMFLNKDESKRKTVRFEDSSKTFKFVHSRLKED